MAYNEKTIIKDKLVEMTPEEQRDVSLFHKSRIAFAILEDGTVALNANDQREHRIYLQEDFGVSEERTMNLVRGYIKPRKIVFYKSFYYDPVEDDLLKLIQTIGVTAVQFFGNGKYEIWNGVRIGDIGTEWQALEIPHTLKLFLRFNRGIHNLYIEEVK